MKQFTSTVTLGLAGILVWILLNFGLPYQPAKASAPAARPSDQLAATATPAAPTPQHTQADPATCDSKRSVQVSGTALINVTPDRALIQLGVESNGATANQVEQVNSTTIKNVITAVKALGVDPQDIATDWYVIDPIYEDYDDLYIKGYRIHNIVAITLRDVTKTSAVVARALEAGANKVISVDLYTSELRKYRDQARDLAMKAAREKAQALAGAAGAEAGCVLNINENTWSYYNGWWGGRSQNQSQNLMTQNVMQNVAPSSNMGGSAAGDEPISLGQISVKAEISASFSLK